MQPAGQKSVFDVCDVVVVLIPLLTLQIFGLLKHAVSTIVETAGAFLLTAACSRLQLQRFQQHAVGLVGRYNSS